MNKTININLGGQPIIIDEDAYNHLTNYLQTIESHFSQTEGCDEIIYDIEVRMAEIFTEVQKGKIVTLSDVNSMIEIIGKPEDFGAESMWQEDASSNEAFGTRKKKERPQVNTGKRVFRNTEDKVLAGVCSGIAAYLGIEEPLWVRLVFIALMFVYGIPLGAYIILWAIIPAAKTPSDKLMMRGEPATVNNIATIIEEEILELKERITELSNKSKSKKKS